MATVSVDALLRYGSTAILVASCVVGIGKWAQDQFFSEGSRRSRFMNEQPVDDKNKKHAFELALVAAKKLVRAAALPVTTIACAWSLALNPEHLPLIVPPLFKQYSQAGTSNFAPLYAKNLQEAFELGQAYREHKQAEMFKDEAGVNNALQKVQALLKRSTPVTSAQLNALPQTLKDIDGKKGPFQRLLGLLTITNVVQGISATVVAGTIVPFFVYVFGERVAKLAVDFFNHVLIPIHHTIKPLYEPFCYAATAVAAVESARYPRGDALSMTGTMSAFTSILMFVGSWLYTTSKIDDHSGTHMNQWISMTSIFFTAYTIPLAILHQSKFLGYLAAAGMAVSLGFSAFSTGMCLFIGFDSKSSLATCTVGCGLLSGAMASAKALELSSRFLEPFQGPVSTISTSVFFLGMLILAEMESRHTQFLGCCASYIISGEMLGLAGMSNAAKTWLGIYGFSRFCIWTSREPDIIKIFGGALTSFFIARFLSRNPKYLTSAIFG